MADWQNFLTINDYLTSGGMVKRVYWNNGVLLGECVKDVDGYWKFGFRADRSGLWDDGPLMLIADMLIELNMEWDQQIKEYFE